MKQNLGGIMCKIFLNKLFFGNKMAFYHNGKLVYDFQKDGKFYKKTKTREGEQSLCQMVQCKCGGWASKKLVNTPTHMANKQHTEWAKKHGQKVVQRYKKKDESTLAVGKHQQEKTSSTIDTSTLFFNDQLYCSIFNFVGPDFWTYTDGWNANSDGLNIIFNVGATSQTQDPNDDFRDIYFLNERYSSRQQIQINYSEISDEGLIEILNGYGQFPKSAQECLIHLIHYHLFREFCLQSFNPQTKTFDESITNAVETSGCTDDEPWKQIHQSIDDELKKSGITPSSSLQELYTFAQHQGSFPTTQRECVLTLLKQEFVSGNHVIDSELLAHILLVPWE